MQTIYPPMSQASNTRDSRHARIVAQRLPDWLTQASPAMRQAMSASQNESHAAKLALAPVLARLRDVTEFCAEQVREALRTQFQLDIDPKRHTLVRAMHNVGMGFSHRWPIEQNLLVAAMQNFEANLAFPAGSMVLPVGGIEYVTAGKNIDFRARSDTPAVDLDPKRFATMCRSLDLGQRYQTHLDTVFKPQENPEQVTALFKRNDRAHFTVLAHIARLRGDVEEDGYRMLLQIAEGSAPTWAGSAVRYHWLRLLGSPDFTAVSLYGVQLIESTVDGRCVVLMPGEPNHPIKQYASFQAFADQLGEKLKESDYRAYVTTLAGEKFATPFSERLSQRLQGSAGGWREHLNLEKRLVVGDLFELQHSDRLIKIYQDARVIAVPTADEDAITLERERRRYLNAGMTLLNIASLLIPALGTAMLTCAAAQLLHEVFSGIDDWRHGDDHAAFTHAMGIAENLATMAVFAGAVHAGTTWIAPKVPEVVADTQLAELVPVTLADGRHDLWRPNLDDYVAAQPLSADLLPDSDGLYHEEGRDSVVIDERVHDILFDDLHQQWRITHPRETDAYRPLIEETGAGWRLAVEQQLEPRGATLRDRLSWCSSGMTEQDIHHALASTGLEPTSLDAIYVKADKPAALLVDTVQRFALHRQVQSAGLAGTAAATRFETLYDATHFGSGPANQLIRRDFPTLSVAAAEEVLLDVPPGEQAQMVSTRRIPLKLAERARAYQQCQRLNRAFEGLCFSVAQSVDSVELAEAVKKVLGQNAQADAVRDYAFAHRDACARWLGQTPLSENYRAPMRDGYGRVGYPMSGRREVALSRRVLVARIRRLYPGTSESAARELLGLYEQTGMSRADIMQGLDNLTYERNQMHAQLDAWSRQPAPANLPARYNASSGDLVYYRADVTARLDIAWRRQLPSERASNGFNYYLNLTYVPLLGFPALSADLRFVTHLNLTGSTVDAPALTNLLGSFTQLRSLTLRECAIAHLPEVVDRLTQLTELDLTLCNLTIDQALLDRLGQLPNLSVLTLSGNTLGQIATSTGFTRLQQLNLAGMTLPLWPLWASRLPALRTLNLYRTRLRHIPDSVFAEPLEANGVDVFMDRNALDQASLRQLERSRPHRRFQFFAHRANDVRPSRVGRPLVDAWLQGANEIERRHRAQLWQGLVDEEGSDAFLQLIDNLRRSPDFTRDAADLTQRVWNVIVGASAHRQLRQRLYTMAQQLDTCVDGERLMFSDMEVQVLQHDALQGATWTQRGRRLYELARGLFRLDRLEHVALRIIAERRRLGVGVDEAEVRMALRTYLARRLALPGQPQSMAYAATARIGVDVYDAAQQQVLQAETEPAFTTFMIRQSFWVDYLREQHATTLERRLAPFADELTALDDSQEPGSSGDYLRRANDIARRREEAENTLLGELTLLEQVGFNSDTQRSPEPSEVQQS
ncbi:NEL-type E3 ubiquitin ligase domain-containing protein [Pseudomonas coleopterorum]|uniref:NEL-type E3 ubiquitin ligase domain-containing protein n=1 Tax=Pseudomonas coleopterorum TaxID=1605838 RepID=UPI00089BE729|nr:NEL-type E3 ubiquitin ligase domain-containing protein [Pseudomonas coleopterorum]SEE53830.1 C-terminal novel E3 ligase, LRR-interacting [Pseudomonas coleopterorum]